MSKASGESLMHLLTDLDLTDLLLGFKLVEEAQQRHRKSLALLGVALVVLACAQRAHRHGAIKRPK